MPAQTIRNWRGGSKQDWRYKLLMFLNSEEVTPKEVERALTQVPEVTPEKESLQSQLQRLESEMAEVKRALSQATSDGLFGNSDAKGLFGKPQAKAKSDAKAKPQTKSDAKVRI